MLPPGSAAAGYELSGFVWHQGWNDGCNTTLGREYEANLANLIRDVRKVAVGASSVILMALPCTCIRCFNRDKQGGASAMTELSPTAARKDFADLPRRKHRALPFAIGSSGHWRDFCHSADALSPSLLFF